VSDTPNAISRKALLTAGAGLAAMALDAGPLRLSALAASGSGNAHLATLMAGNARFVAGTPRCVPATARRTELANGQAPFAAVLGCSDSRVPVETIFDHDPGDVFVVRIAGNFVTDAGLGSLEYSVAVLKSELVMVLGHSACGAVKAAMDAVKGETFPGHIQGLATAIEPAAKAVKNASGDWFANAIAENVRRNVTALTAQSKILADAKAAGTITIVGAVYDLHTGKVARVV
jgi:carbonic anhydrase